MQNKHKFYFIRNYASPLLNHYLSYWWHLICFIHMYVLMSKSRLCSTFRFSTTSGCCSGQPYKSVGAAHLSNSYRPLKIDAGLFHSNLIWFHLQILLNMWFHSLCYAYFNSVCTHNQIWSMMAPTLIGVEFRPILICGNISFELFRSHNCSLLMIF